MSHLPYSAEYAKSGRSACKGCKQLIGQGTLRLAIMVQSSFFDGMQANWYHSKCFFIRTRAKSTDEIKHYENLRWADQEDIRNRIGEQLNDPCAVVAPATNGKKSKGKKGKRQLDESLPRDLLDYTVEYAKSGRSKCKVCEQMIPKAEIRISKKDYEGEVAKKYGPTEQWHHVACFLRARNELRFYAAGSVLPGFNALSPDDQETIKSSIPAITPDGTAASPPKKPKLEENPDLMKRMKEQNASLYKFRDELEALPKRDLILLLEHNKQYVPEGVDRILNNLADLMAFGNLPRCSKCSGGHLSFNSGLGYKCNGFITDFTECSEVYEKPQRTNFKIPLSLKNAYPFLSNYKCKTVDRAFKKCDPVPATVANAVLPPPLPLYGLSLIIHKTVKGADDVKKKIMTLGGKIVKDKDFSSTVAAVISLPSEVAKTRLLKVIKQSKDADVPVVTEDFLSALSTSSTRADVINVFRDKTCSTWGLASIDSKLPADIVDGATSSKSVYPAKSATKSIYKSDATVQKVLVKDGTIVDPDSKLAKKAHVYKTKEGIYSVVLTHFDVQAQKNSYYKLQVLESDKGNKYWLFRSWGRIGTTIGGNRTEEYGSVQDAVYVFEEKFEEKTGNQWYARQNFVKVPSKMMMLEVDLATEFQELRTDPTSKLPMQVQQLLTLIFDIKTMEKTMLEFELDLNKMPLGKLSQKQITSAFSILNELTHLQRDGTDRTLIIDRTNRFYTLVPHDFGIGNGPLLDNDEIIAQKISMLNNLMDIEIAYNMLGGSSDGSMDAHYQKLKADISVLDNTSSEFKDIDLYLKSTHASTHGHYALKIQNVFKVERQGENKRFKPFQKLDNRKLLWHGSRLTNFGGILSQGLRIAPPEAPVTGYMFGKGIYFADMVSKSANYCGTTSMNATGLLLLCDVALGNMHEVKQATAFSKPPSGFNSVKGVGTTHPDPSKVGKSASGALIPYGKPKPNKVTGASLLYNEYIVYDVSQVKIEYLVHVNFDYSGHR